MSSTRRLDQRIAVIIPAKDEAERITTTVRACRSISRADFVIVVDGGSTGETQDHTRATGAVTVRHFVLRGKASTMETEASIVAVRDYSSDPARLLLFIGTDLGDSVTSCVELVSPVIDGVADMSIAVPPKQSKADDRGRVIRATRQATSLSIEQLPVTPPSDQRYPDHEAYGKAMSLIDGWRMRVDLAIGVLVAGLAAIEVPCDIAHRVAGNDRVDTMYCASQYRDILRAITRRKLRHHHVPRASLERATTGQNHFFVYRAVPQPPEADDAEPIERPCHTEGSQVISEMVES